MEKQLEDRMSGIMSKPGVVGAICVDKKGLTLSVSGVARPEMSGIISSIADQARKLEPSSSVNPVIRLESDQGYCLIQKKGDFTMGIFKKHS